MLEGHIADAGLNIVDALPVPADVEFHIAGNHPVHMGARLDKAFVQFHGIALGSEPGEVFGVIRLHCR